MRILLASAAAASFAFAATPAFAQHGGSPAEQVDGAPNEAGSAPEGENTLVDVPSYENADEAEIAGKDQAGEDYALADVDADLDVDADIDTDMDRGELQPPPPGETYDAVEPDEAGPEADGATWQGEDGRAYCRRSDGTTGLVIGGGAGALVGREIGRDGRHNRRRGRGGGTAGAIIGGLIGAVVGSAVERSASEQACR